MIYDHPAVIPPSSLLAVLTTGFSELVRAKLYVLLVVNQIVNILFYVFKIYLQSYIQPFMRPACFTLDCNFSTRKTHEHVKCVVVKKKKLKINKNNYSAL